MSVIPIVTVSDPQSSAAMIAEMLRSIQMQKSSIHLGIRASLQILQSLDDSLHKQLSPFISSGRVRMYPDSLDVSFQGLMSLDVLRSYVQKGFKTFRDSYPESSPIFIPRWHDVNRAEAQALYKEFGTTLIPTQNRNFVKVLSADMADTEERIIPCVFPHGANPKQFCKSIEAGIHRRTSSIKKLISQKDIRLKNAGEEKNWDTIIFINGDADCHIAMESLSIFAAKNYTLSSGASGMQYLCAERSDSYSDIGAKSVVDSEADSAAESVAPSRSNARSLFPFDFPHFDLPQFGPDFIAQLFPSGRKNSRRPALLSTANPLPPPIHRHVQIPSARKLTSIMLGESEFHEKEFIVQFSNGNIASISQNHCGFHFSKGIDSGISIQKSEKIRNYSYVVENAFAIEGEGMYGLRQLLTAEQAGLRIAGRIINDFLIINEAQELYIDSYIQHPWLEDDYSYFEYIPQMLALSNIPADRESICIRSQNFDSSERSISIRLDSLDKRELIFLPGRAWILDCAQYSIGIDLVCSRRERIHLPAAVLLERVNKKEFQLSFLPTAVYTRPEVSTINGLMEHYTLRLKPAVSEFDDFAGVGNKTLGVLEKAFIVYF